jgi:ATP-dependent Clp endopeptidase proteolytic subunit ClpP
MDGTRSLVQGGEIFLYGIVDGYAGPGEGIRALDVIRSLAEIDGDTIVARINSPGGSVTEGIAIYNALKADPRKVVVRVDAIAASIASVIAMAGDDIVMADNASLMIHDPWSVAVGGSNDMRAMADEIDRLRDIILNIYETRTGLSRDQISAMMAKETFMGAGEAVDLGFATSLDEITLKIAACALLERTVLARLIGLPQSDQGSAPPTTAAIAVNQKGLDMTTSSEAAVAAAPAAPTIDAEAIRAEAAAAERKRVSDILALGTRAKVDQALVDKLVADVATVDAARAEIMDAMIAASGPETMPAVRVIRDGTQTRAEGMAEAMSVLMLGKSQASEKARPYMEFTTLAEMAADLTGYRGSLFSPAKRQAVIENAMHTTSDFPEILLNALNKTLDARYAQAMPTYRMIAKQRTYNDFRAHYTIRAGDFPHLQSVTEAGEIKSGTFSDTKESTVVLPYAVQFSLTRQLMVNDTLNAIGQVLGAQGDEVARFEESTFYNHSTYGFLSNTAAGPTLTETGRGVFNTTDDTQAGSGAAISVTTLGAGRQAIRKRTSLDGAYLNLNPTILLVGPAYETLAQQYVTSTQPTQGSEVNPFTGSLKIIVTPYITGNAWYMMVDPGVLPCFEWGLLAGYTAPRLRVEDVFGYQGMRVSLEHDFGCGGINFRGGWRNPGA